MIEITGKLSPEDWSQPDHPLIDSEVVSAYRAGTLRVFEYTQDNGKAQQFIVLKGGKVEQKGPSNNSST